MANDNKQPSDAQILARLRRSRGGKTAKQLGTTSARLRALDGVVEVGHVSTGKAGRPAILFDVEEHAAEVAALPNNDEVVDGPSEAQRERSGDPTCRRRPAADRLLSHRVRETLHEKRHLDARDEGVRAIERPSAPQRDLPVLEPFDRAARTVARSHVAERGDTAWQCMSPGAAQRSKPCD